MRRWTRIAMGVLAAILIAGGLAFLARHELSELSNRDIGALIVRRLASTTGIELISAGSKTSFSYHAVVRFSSPRLMWKGRELMRAGSISMVFGYRTLLLHGGLPLLDVIVRGPRISLPPGAGAPPMPDARTAAAIRQGLSRVAKFTRRVDISGGRIADASGAAILEMVNIAARRGFSADSPWQLRAGWHHPASTLPAFSGGAQLLLAPEVEGERTPVVSGSLWASGASLGQLLLPAVRLAGELTANATLSLDNTGTIGGSIRLQIARFGFGGHGNSPLIAAGPVSAAAKIKANSRQVRLSEVEFGGEGGPAFAKGTVALAPPLGANPEILLSLSLRSLGIGAIKGLLSQWPGLPGWVAQARAEVAAGKLTVDRLALDAKLAALRRPELGALAAGLKLDATVSGLRLMPVAGLPLPPDNGLDGELHYAGGVLHLSQAQAHLGSSRLSQISLSADLSQAPRIIAYHLLIRGELAPAGLYPLAQSLMPPALRRKLASVRFVSGRIGAEIMARGRMIDLALSAPLQYRVNLSPAMVRFSAGPAAEPYEISGGRVEITQEAIDGQRVDVVPGHGRATLSGEILRRDGGGYSLRELDCALHGVNAQRWLPYLVDPSKLAIDGPVGGNLIVTHDGAKQGYALSGGLTFGPGKVVFGFLRSPVILVNAGRATFDNHAVILAMPGSRFEGAQLDLSVRIPDFRQPAIRIDATAERLDLLAIKAIRMPWSQHAFHPPAQDNTRYSGRVVARAATFGPLAMKNLSANFKRNDKGWRVDHLTADTLGGKMAMKIDGVRDNDWINIDTTLTGVDMAQLQALGGWQTAVITGRLTSQSSLRANTDGDFIQTLGGKVSVRVRNGVLHRLTLLSRMLALVDISQWLNASVPNPAVAGVPFTNIRAHFSGENGVFTTEDFLLHGPVMEITAAGKVELPSRRLDLQVGMRPFQLLGTVFNKIPFIGTRLAASQNGLVAAYFNVRGPIADPSVVPAPITSISKILIRTLAIPVNILIPNTIK